MVRSSILSVLIASIALFLVAGCQPGSDAAATSKLTWTEDFQSARTEAKKSGKLMMVDFNATWCGPCQQYKQDVFPTSEFSDAAKDFVLVDIDIEQQQDLAQKYRVSSIPDIRIFDGDGNEVGKVVGYGGADHLLTEMKRAKASVTR